MFDIQYRLCSIYFTGLYCTVQYNFLFCLFYLFLSPNSFNLPRAILFMTCTVCNVRVLHLEYERFKDINWSNGALLYVYIMFSCWAEHIALQWKITYSLIYCMYRYVVCERGCQLSSNLLLMQSMCLRLIYVRIDLSQMHAFCYCCYYHAFGKVSAKRFMYVRTCILLLGT